MVDAFTVIVNVQLAEAVPSAAVQVTILVPWGKPEPEGGEQVTVAVAGAIGAE